jgi:hypothetical protein
VKKALANSEPSTHGTKRTITALQQFVCFWGTADIADGEDPARSRLEFFWKEKFMPPCHSTRFLLRARGFTIRPDSSGFPGLFSEAVVNPSPGEFMSLVCVRLMGC